MSPAAPRRHYTYGEYLALDEESNVSSHHRRLFRASRPLRAQVLAAFGGDGDGVFVADA